MADDKKDWTPPGKNCGMCGASSCADLVKKRSEGTKKSSDCPYYEEKGGAEAKCEVEYARTDNLGKEYDFVLTALPGEKSARKLVLPFRGDLVEKMDIKRGDIVLGRPMGQGCPLQHVIEVIEADQISGVITGWVVGPKYSRDKAMESVKDVKAYHVIGFEGMVKIMAREPVFGMRQRFLPGYCMMGISHTAVVNMVLQKKEGTFVKLEDIRIM